MEQKNVTKDLHRLKNVIANPGIVEEASADNIPEAKPAPPENEELKKEREEKKELEKKLKQALKKRREEFIKIRRDVIGRLTESLAVLPDDIVQCKDRMEEAEKAQAFFKGLLYKLENLDDSEWNPDNYSSELADAMKTVENSRLEFLRYSAKLTKNYDRTQTNIKMTKQDSLLLELNSLSFRQLFRLGLFFFFPLVAALVLAALIISAAMIFSMGAW